MNSRTLQIALILLIAACGRAFAQDTEQPTLSDNLSNGDVLSAQSAMLAETPAGVEKFLSPAADIHNFAGGTIVMRPDATIVDDVIHIKNICRWNERDAAMFAPVADLSVAHFPSGRSDLKVTIDQIRQTLAGAGINPALVSFDGAMNCAVHRDIGAVQEQMSMDQWIDSHRTDSPTAVAAAATQSPVQASTIDTQAAAPDPLSIRQLRKLLAVDLSDRLHVDPNNLELKFNSTDDKILNLAEPYFQFQIIPKRVRVLGDVEWDVVVTAGSQHQKATIDATARAWITEAIVRKPIAYQQTIAEGDIEEKRVLVDALSSQTLLTKAQVIGQSANRDLFIGIVLTPDMVQAQVLARPGQLITVTVERGNIRLTAVAKSLQTGSLGQIIRARSDVDPTKLFEVTLTGPQQGTVSSSPDDNAPIAAAAH